MYFFLFKKLSREEKTFANNLKKLFGFRPRKINLYKTAFRHSSANINEKLYFNDNERLEFVGDAVIGLIVSDLLYTKFPKAKEGKLSVLRANIVNRKSLNSLAEKLEIDKFISYKSYNGNVIKHLRGNTFEALVAAIYFDRGYKFAKKFVIKIIVNNLDLINLMHQNTDYKSKLLQLIQKFKLNICYNTFENCEENEGNYHFLCELSLDGKYLSEGKAWTKKEAEQIASRQALKKLDYLRL